MKRVRCKPLVKVVEELPKFTGANSVSDGLSKPDYPVETSFQVLQPPVQVILHETADLLSFTFYEVQLVVWILVQEIRKPSVERRTNNFALHLLNV